MVWLRHLQLYFGGDVTLVALVVYRQRVLGVVGIVHIIEVLEGVVVAVRGLNAFSLGDVIHRVVCVAVVIVLRTLSHSHLLFVLMRLTPLHFPSNSNSKELYVSRMMEVCLNSEDLLEYHL